MNQMIIISVIALAALLIGLRIFRSSIIKFLVIFALLAVIVFVVVTVLGIRIIQ